MTRLQKMLSQIKTIEELAELVRTEPNHIFEFTGISKDGKRLINCNGNRTSCKDCAAYINKSCTAKYDNFRAFVNAEIPEPVYADTDSVKTTDKHVPHVPIIKLRDNARKLLKSVVFEGFKQGHSAQTVYNHLDEYIDVLEGVGLFEENELRGYVATDLLKDLLNKKYGDNTK